MIFCAIILALWLLGFVVFWRLPLPHQGKLPPTAPPSLLSFVIPSRNEEQNLPALLRSIFSQPALPHEVIVVDDASTDRTATVARDLGATVLTSEPLPDGWRGKTWACHQGAKAASGDVLLFLDADTWFEPDGLQKIVSTYKLSGGAVSVGPYHAVQRPYEHLSAFFNLVMTVGTGAFTILDHTVTSLGLFGQMLMVDRPDYFRVGGHESVKGRTLENFALAQHFRSNGVPIHCYGGRGALSFRMYPEGLQQLVEGWTKGFASGAAQTPLPLLLLIIAWLTGMISAVMLLVWQARTESICIYLLFVLQLYAMFRRIGAFRWYSALFYPGPLLFYIAVFSRSVWSSGRQVQWKGRDICAD